MNLILQAIKSMFRNIEQQIAKLSKTTKDLQALSEFKPDWNQNDPEAPDYIENRPFYSVVSDTPYIKETSVTNYDIQDNGIYRCYVSLDVNLKFDPNKSYLFRFDGKDYVFRGSYAWEDWYSYWYLGNGSLYSDILPNTGEDFVLIREDEEGYGGSDMFCSVDNNPHVFSVYDIENTKISDLYLPNTKPLIVNGVSYNGLEQVQIETIGRQGSGSSSEAFNGIDPQDVMGMYSHAEGINTSTSREGQYAHAEGNGSQANNQAAHAEGYSSIAAGRASHAEGYHVQALARYQHAQGKYNVPAELVPVCGLTDSSKNIIKSNNVVYADSYEYDTDTRMFTLIDPIYGVGSDIMNKVCYFFEGTSPSGQEIKYKFLPEYTNPTSTRFKIRYQTYTIDYERRYAHIVGNGDSEDNRSNAHTLDWNGNAWYAGDVYIGGESQDNATRLARIDEIPDSYSKEETDQRIQELGAPSDWNQNDDEASDYIKNRTHWTEIGDSTVVLLDNVPCLMEVDDKPFLNNDGLLYYRKRTSIKLPSPLVVGNSYEITLSGAPRSVDGTYIYDGNSELYAGAEIWEPSLTYDEESLELIYKTNGSPNNASVSEYEAVLATIIETKFSTEINHALDDKYIPETIPRIKDVSTLINYAELVAVDDGEGNISFHRLNQPPNIIDADCVEDSVPWLSSATLKITTTETVEFLQIKNSEGRTETITIENVEIVNSEKIWTLKIQVAAFGTNTYTVIGYGANKVSGTIKNVIVEVTF